MTTLISLTPSQRMWPKNVIIRGMVLQLKKTQYGDFNATYDEFYSRFEVLEFKVNAMEREMESLRKWEAEKSEMIMTMKTLEKELKVN